MNHWVCYHSQVTLTPDTHVSRLRAPLNVVNKCVELVVYVSLGACDCHGTINTPRAGAPYVRS